MFFKAGSENTEFKFHNGINNFTSKYLYMFLIQNILITLSVTLRSVRRVGSGTELRILYTLLVFLFRYQKKKKGVYYHRAKYLLNLLILTYLFLLNRRENTNEMIFIFWSLTYHSNTEVRQDKEENNGFLRTFFLNNKQYICDILVNRIHIFLTFPS